MFLEVVSKPVAPKSSPSNNVGLPTSPDKNLITPNAFEAAGPTIRSNDFSLRSCLS